MEETDISYDEIQEVLDGIMQGQSFSFSELVHSLFTGGEGFDIGKGLAMLPGKIVEVILGENRFVFYLLALAFIGALFTNFSKMLQKKQVAQAAFYVTYMLFFSTLAAAFQVILRETSDQLGVIVEFMKALVPAYFLSLAFASDAASSAVFYQMALLVIGMVEFLIQKFILPLIQTFFILQMLNQIAEEDSMSKLAKLLEKMIHWVLKTVFLFVIGLQVIQGMVVPGISAAKKTMLIKLGGAVPGVGNTFQAAAETILSSAGLLKNAVGAAGLVALVTILVLPLAKLMGQSFLYGLVMALIQPVSDKRIIGSVEGMSHAIHLLLHVVSVCGILFFLSVAIVSTLT